MELCFPFSPPPPYINRTINRVSFVRIFHLQLREKEYLFSKLIIFKRDLIEKKKKKRKTRPWNFSSSTIFKNINLIYATQTKEKKFWNLQKTKFKIFKNTEEIYRVWGDSHRWSRKKKKERLRRNEREGRNLQVFVRGRVSRGAGRT